MHLCSSRMHMWPHMHLCSSRISTLLGAAHTASAFFTRHTIAREHWAVLKRMSLVFLTQPARY